MKKKLLLGFVVLFALLLVPQSSAAHDIHISMVSINYNPETKSLEIAVKAYTDDLEAAIEKSGAPLCKLNTENELADSDIHIYNYFKQVLAIELEGEKQSLEFVGKEYEDLTTWSYLEVSGVDDIQQILVYYSLFMEMYSDQNNIVNVTVGEEKKSTVLTVYQRSETFSF